MTTLQQQIRNEAKIHQLQIQKTVELEHSYGSTGSSHKLKIWTGQLHFRPSELIPVVSMEMSMLRCAEERTMLMRDLILTAGHPSVPTDAAESGIDLSDCITIGSQNVKMV